jgi:hypothetical protein
VKSTEKRHTILLGLANRVLLRVTPVTRQHGLRGGMCRHRRSPIAIPAGWENCHENAVKLVDT